jgi:hypothetical protein
VRKEEEEVAAAEKQLRGKSEGEKGFNLKYASTKEVVGRNMVRRAEAAAHLPAKN